MVQSDVKRLESVVIPFIINITMEINFSSKVYSKGLLKGSPMSCTSNHILSRSMEADILQK